MDLFSEFNFDDLFESMWNRFNRPVKDLYPYSVYRSEGKGFVVICNTLGMDKNDLSVRVETQKGTPYPILHIKGNTDLQKINYKNSVDLAIQLRFDKKIESVNYEVKNGLTTVYIKTEQQFIEPAIEAKCLEDDDAFDW